MPIKFKKVTQTRKSSDYFCSICNQMHPYQAAAENCYDRCVIRKKCRHHKKIYSVSHNEIIGQCENCRKEFVYHDLNELNEKQIITLIKLVTYLKKNKSLK